MEHADLYTKERPFGQLTALVKWPGHIRIAVETGDGYRGKCPCCDRRIVILPQGSTFTDDAKEQLLT